MSMLHTFLGIYQLISLQKISKERRKVYWLLVCIFHYKKISTVKEQTTQSQNGQKNMNRYFAKDRDGK